MDTKHLWWIIPIAILLGFILGYFVGVYDTVTYLRNYTGNVCNLL